MGFLTLASVAVFVVASTIEATTVTPFDCNNMPWPNYSLNSTTKKCTFNTVYGCTKPKDLQNTCEDCQRAATGGKADKKCTGLKVFIRPELKSGPCDDDVRWQFNTYTGRCSTMNYGCLAKPETVGFSNEQSCLDACEGIPLCG